MDFRYKLAKEEFKNKKIPPKRGLGESTISSDQRGNHTSPNVPGSSNPLSKDKGTITPKEEPVEKKEVSRRGFLSFLDQLEVPEEKTEKQKKPPAPEAVRKEAKEEAPVSAEPLPPQPGIFRRSWNKVKSVFREIEETPVTPAEEVAEEMTEAVPPPEPEIVVKRVGEEEEERVQPVAESKPGKTPEPTEEEEKDPDEEAMSRRNLMRSGIHFFAKPAVDSVQNKIDTVNKTVDQVTKRLPLLRPPGAISERAFLQACTRCDACINACPKDALKKATKKMGFFIMGTPYIDPLQNPCVMCDDLPCISACEDRALLPVPSPADVNMGYAILDKKKCQAYGDTFCQQCVIDCPIPGAITQTPVDRKPVFHKNICTGCGVCARSCSTVNIPPAIRIKPQMVIDSQLARKKREHEEQERLAQKQKEKQERAEEERRGAEAAEQGSVQNSE
ncbi:MAG: hypothetical protein VYC17_03535 [Nitrospinota bacterium]|nr:hypothetical protein [Nitrospinota bacterium]